MAITIEYPIDEVELASLISDGYVSLTLWYTTTPDGAYSNANATVNRTLAQAVTAAAAGTAGAYVFTLTASTPTPAHYFRVRAFDGGSVYSDLSAAPQFHGGGGTTLAVIRQQLGKLLHDMEVGTLTGGTGTTGVVATANFKRFGDDYFNGWYFHRTAPAVDAEWTLVSDWVQSTGTFTVSPGFTLGDGAASDSIEVTRRWTPDEYREAINWAIINSYPAVSRPVTSTQLRTQLSTEESKYTYWVTGDIRRIDSVEIEPDPDTMLNSELGHPWRQIAFTPIRQGVKVGFEVKNPLPYDRRLRVTGTGLHNGLNGDGDYVELLHPEVDLIVYLAAHRLWSLLPNNAASADIERYEKQAQYYLGMYAAHRGQFSPGRKPRRFWTHDQVWGSNVI